MKFSIDLQLIQDRKIEDLDKLLYAIMDSLSQNGQFNIPLKTLLSLTNYNKVSINNALKRLATNGYISYQINDDKIYVLIISEQEKLKQAQLNQEALEQAASKQADAKSKEHLEQIEIIKSVINFLNVKLNKHLKYETQSYQKLIISLLKHGYTKNDMINVINKKYNDWNGTAYIKYLRPSTIFRQNKFDQYLNEINPNEQAQHRMDKYNKVGQGDNKLKGGW